RLSSGTFGPKGTRGTQKLKEPRANGKSRVFTAKRDKEARIGQFREICPRSLGQLGQKYARDMQRDVKSKGAENESERAT
ncbi:hypothetical protein KI387_030489, partial [Taxus chinensis]